MCRKLDVYTSFLLFFGEEKMNIGYIRVSTDRQPFELQKRAITDFTKIRNIIIDKWYVDTISGKTDSRPAFNELMDDIRKGVVSNIYVYKLDRIGRSVQHLLQLFQEFKNLNVEFVSISQNINTDTAEGRLMLRILMILAEYERELTVSRINDRLSQHKRDIKERGFYINKDGVKKESLGRPAGSKDKKRRKRSGYYQRWANHK